MQNIDEGEVLLSETMNISLVKAMIRTEMKVLVSEG